MGIRVGRDFRGPGEDFFMGRMKERPADGLVGGLQIMGGGQMKKTLPAPD